ncbi:MAG: hypothetical protein WKF75_11890 [Singulisphaera sp.]
MAGESVLVFAQAEGFRPGGRVVAAGVEEADLKLDRSDEAPSEVGPRPPPPTTRDEDKAVVTRLLAPLRSEGDGRPPSPYSSDILAAMARARPEEVIDLVQQQIVAVDDRLAAEIALGLYESDRNAALAAIESVRGNYTAARAAMDAFDARPDADPSWRRALLELALKRAREEADPSRRAWLLGWVADRLFLMGATDRATAVVREAEALVADRPRGAFLHPRDAVAAPLARIDPKAALDLIGPARDGTSNDRSIYSGAFAAVAERVAATRPEEAERLFALVTEDGYRERSLPALCARMAWVDLPRARRMAGSAKGPARQAAALGAAARALAKSDPKAARPARRRLRPARRPAPGPVELLPADGLAPTRGRADRPPGRPGVPLANPPESPARPARALGRRTCRLGHDRGPDRPVRPEGGRGRLRARGRAVARAGRGVGQRARRSPARGDLGRRGL